MADDLQQRMAQLQMPQAGGKPGYLFGCIPLDWNANGGLAMQSCSPFAKNIPALGGGTGKAGGMGDKFLNACMQAADQLREINKGSPIVYGGDIQSAGGGGLGNMGRGGGFEIT